MTILPFFFFLLTLTLTTLPTTFSATCTTTNHLYSQCTTLPSLNSTLHYTYTSSNSTLSVAFTATPPSPSGWVAWGINPIATGMAGTQAILAYKSSSDGSVSVSTFNLSSYSDIIPGPLSFPVYSKRAQFNSADGSITIFAVVKADSKKVNHVWQVGPAVTKGFPVKHDFKPANLMSKLTIDLSSPASGSSSSSDKASSSTADAGFGLMKRNVGYFAASLAFVLFFFLCL